MPGVDLVLVVPGSIERRTGGTIYDRRVVEGLVAAGARVDVLELEGAFPAPDVRDETAAYAALAAIPSGACAVVDGLALGALPRASVECRCDLVALVHHPLCDETGLEPAVRDRLHASERAALAGVTRVVVTADFTRRRLLELGLVDGERHDIHVVEPGVAALPADPAPARAPGEPLRLVSLGAVTARKSYGDVAEALWRLAGLDVEWEHVGDLEASPDEAQRLRAAIERAGLAERVHLAGVLDDDAVQRALQRAHAFIHPARYEGYGMAPREALAHGLPLVVSRGGALAETVPDAASLRFAPGDVAALAEHVRTIAGDDGALRRLRAAALGERERARTWDVAAAEFGTAIEGGVRA